MGETYYDVLGISPDATQEEIVAAYRERVLETHPDRNDEPDAAEQFKAVTTAETVLSDETERARYDRLGHDAYVTLADRFAPSSTESDSGDDRSSPSPETDTDADDDSSGFDSSFGFDPSVSAGTDAGSSRSRSRSRTHSTDARDGPSHHARHRTRRQRARANARDGFGATRRTGPSTTTNPWSSVDERRSAGGSGSRTETESQTGTEVDDESTFRYAVHDWTDDVDLEDSTRSLEQSAIVTACCVTFLYPLLVYSSVTPQFSIVTNAVVAVCTLILVGYLLTTPRIAIAAFGGWSVLVPLGLFRLTAMDPFSLVGVLVVVAFWLPFGYAVAVWWVLHPRS